MEVLEAEVERLRAAIDAVVPADDFPSASEAGGLRFWSQVTRSERPDWADRVITVLDLLDRRSGGRFAGLDVDARAAVLDGLVEDPDFVWFAQLVNAGFYADPGNGGNDDAVSWRMLGWSPAPAGGWPAEDVWVPDRGPIIRRDQVAARYDAVVVGSGAGGGVAAWALAQSGRSVLLVERGDYPDTAYLARDHLRNARTDSGLDHRTLRSSAENPRTLLLGMDPVVLPAWDPRYGSNADTFGGGTRVYGAQAWRFMAEDFTMASTYGIPDGSALADWPIGYDEMEPFYTQAEYEIGVCGSAEPHSGSTRRSPAVPDDADAPDGARPSAARRCRGDRPDHGAGAACHQLHAVRRPGGVRSLPAVRRLRLPRRGQERFAQHCARPGGRDRELQRPARDPHGADPHRHHRTGHRRRPRR